MLADEPTRTELEKQKKALPCIGRKLAVARKSYSDLYGNAPVAYLALKCKGILENLETLLEREGDQIREEFKVVRVDGEVRWFSARCWIFHEAYGRTRHIAGINYDITDRMQSEETVRLESEAGVGPKYYVLLPREMKNGR